MSPIEGNGRCRPLLGPVLGLCLPLLLGTVAPAAVPTTEGAGPRRGTTVACHLIPLVHQDCLQACTASAFAPARASYTLTSRTVAMHQSRSTF